MKTAVLLSLAASASAFAPAATNSRASVAVQETIQADLIELMETLDWADADKAWKTLQNWSF